jgi:hypothetical protein
MRKLIVNSLVLIWIVLNSIYLTNFIERNVQLSLYQFVFILLYFAGINVLGFALILKQQKNMSRKILAIISVISFFMIIAGGDFFDNHRKQDVSIDVLATGEKTKNSLGTEVWITGIEVDNKRLNLAELANINWEFRGNSLVNFTNQPSTLSLNLRYVSDIKVKFLKHQWSGIARIEGKSIDLYSKEGNEFIYDFKSKPVQKNIYNYLDIGMAYLLLFSISLFLLALIKKKKFLFGFVTLLLYLLLYQFIEGVYLDKLSNLILILISFLSGALFLNERIKIFIRKFILSDKLTLSIFIFTSLVISFFAVGNNLFFSNGFLDVTIRNILLFILVWTWSTPFIILFLYSLEKINLARNINESSKLNKSLLFFSLIIIQSTIGLIMLSIYYPGNMTSDSIDQWKQAQGLLPISDAHPAFHTIVISLLTKIYNSPAFIVSIQILFASLVLSSILIFLHKQGLRKLYVFGIAALFWLIPNNAIYIVTLWKDIPYTISLVWLTFLLLKSVQKRESITLINIFELSVALSFVYLFRHNGVIPFILSIIVILGYVFKSRRIRFLFVIPIALIFIILVKGPLFSAFQVEKSATGLEFIAPVHGIASVIAHNGNLSPETINYMKEIMPLEEWKRLYDPYNANPYMFGNNYALTYKLSLGDTKEILMMYLDTLVRNPVTVIYDRLTGVGLMWQITQPTTSYNSRYVSTIVDNDIGLEAHGNSLSGLYNKILQTTENITIIDTVIWRGGFPTLVLLLVVFFLFKKKNYAYLIALTPLIGNIISLFLSMSWQDYRYVYFEFFIMIFIILSLFLKKNGTVGETL